MATASAVSKGAKGVIAPPHPITWPQNPPHARTALSAPPRMGLPCRLLRHNSSLFPLCAVIDATAEDQLGLHLRRRSHRQTAPSSARPPLHSRPRSAWPSPSPWTRHAARLAPRHRALRPRASARLGPRAPRSRAPRHRRHRLLGVVPLRSAFLASAPRSTLRALPPSPQRAESLRARLSRPRSP